MCVFLSCSQLQGTIQANSTLFHLRHLQSLNLGLNDFNLSRIPSEFGSFASLTHLNVFDTNFAGRIPSTTSHLSKLISLDLSHFSYNLNQGRLEQHTFNMLLQNLTQLRELRLDDLNISSPLPHALLNLSSFTSLSLCACQLRGKFSENIFHFPNLRELDVHGNSELTGKLPNFNVTSSLQFLDLSFTSFSGQLPESISNLKALNKLYLINNNFSGSIPASFGNLTQITDLGFWSNNFSGQIPSSISNLAKLPFLDLSRNNFNGQIPNSLGNMSQLTHLFLYSNQLTGPIPSYTNLTGLELSSNNLSGVVDLDKLLKLKNLIYLDLSYNGLSLSINNSVNSTLTNFDTIGLASCNLSEFPNFLREQASLYSLDLSNNKIHGEVPKWLFNVGKDSLINLDLSRNFLTSLERLSWKNLQFIDLHSNLFRGPLPVPPNTTYVFSISNNKLTGEIPPLICGLSSLQVLVLSNNSLSGLTPQCLGNLSTSLSVLNLGINSFSGTFTVTFTKGNCLRNLNLNGNQIQGQVSRSLLNCEYLQVLDLGKNKINDTFPHWLETLTELQVLVLRYNRFHGHIDTSKTKSKHPFPKLRIMDISRNEFTGLLPTNYIKQFGAMMNVDEHVKFKYMGETYYQDSVVVVMKGNEIEYSRILTVFSIIDFSRNKFQGEIPKFIGRLNSLRGLNLSHNNLEGRIPTSLGNLEKLESLDLSSNNGNLALCGFPLSKKYKKLQPPPPPPTLQQDENSDNSSGFNWQVVVLGYGCEFVFGMVMGYHMFLTRRPEWLTKIVEGKHHKKVKRSKNGTH
ncbi:hypothetical protein ACSBR1_012596 [Camellia fascicularis]